MGWWQKRLAADVNPRERYRAQVRADIKLRAWEQIRVAGVSSLSLNAIAKSIGVSGPALYRYFGSRDELLTELIRDTYRNLADVMQTACDSGADAIELADAVRQWALPNPQQYFLLFGTPVPGYHAPADTTDIADEVMGVLIATFARVNDHRSAAHQFAIHLRDHRQWAGMHPQVSTGTLRLAISFWTRLHGVLSLELADQFVGMGFDAGLLLREEIRLLTQRATTG